MKKRWNVKQNSLSSVACKVKNSSDFWFIINQILFFKYTTYIFYRSIRISFACKRFPFFNICIVPATAFTSNSYKESWEVWVHDLTLELLSVVQVHFHWRKNVLHDFPIGKHFTNSYNISEAWGIICKHAIGTYSSDLYYLASVNIIIKFNLATR